MNHVTHIVGAVIRRNDEILLVRQQSVEDEGASWTIPAGQVEPGELLHEALRREVREETGLQLVPIASLAFLAHAANPEECAQIVGEPLKVGETVIVAVFEAAVSEGAILCQHPDGDVTNASFFPPAKAHELLSALPWRVMREPIAAYLKGHAPAGATWFYRGTPDGAYELVSRVPEVAPPARSDDVAHSSSVERHREHNFVAVGCLALLVLFAILFVIGLITVFHWGS